MKTKKTKPRESMTAAEIRRDEWERTGEANSTWIESMRAYIRRDAKRHLSRGNVWRHDECMRLIRRPKAKDSKPCPT